MQVTGWTYWENDQYKDVDEMPNDVFYKAKQAVIKEMYTKGYKFTGESHQHVDNCTPIIDNEYKYNVSMRSWGDIMCQAYELPNNDGLGYVAWAWNHPEDEVFPEANK